MTSLYSTNKWESQRIHKRFKNSHAKRMVNTGLRWKPYNSSKRKSNSTQTSLRYDGWGWRDLYGRNLRVHHKNINKRLFCKNYNAARLNIDSMYDDDDDDDYYYYQSSSHSEIFLADFLPSNDIYDDENILVHHKKQNKNKDIDDEQDIIVNIQTEIIKNENEKYKMNKYREELSKYLCPIISDLCDGHYFVNYYVESIINNDYWIKQILNIAQKDGLQFIYTLDTKNWEHILQQLQHPHNDKKSIGNSSNTLNSVKDVIEFQRNDAMIKLCGIQLLCHGYLRLRNNENEIYIPCDIVGLLANFCGIMTCLLPIYDHDAYNTNKNYKFPKCIDIIPYKNITKQTIEIISNRVKGEFIFGKRKLKYAPKWMNISNKTTYNEMYICIKLGGNIQRKRHKKRLNVFMDGTQIGYDIFVEKQHIEFGNIIPILKISSITIDRWMDSVIKYKGWISKYIHINTNNVSDDEKRIIRNKGHICSWTDKYILKYAKTRDLHRYIRRKWSSYGKIKRLTNLK